MSDETYEILAVKYAERNARTRADSFLFDDDHAAPHPMDYFLWVVRNGTRTIVVDTGYDEAEGSRRGRNILRHPRLALEAVGVDASLVETVIITHLHYDHAGTLDAFPNALFHLQSAELAFATGPCMCDTALQHPFTIDHVVAMVKCVYSGRVVFTDGDGAVAPGVTLHRIGGHSRGLQAVRVKTARGFVVLASDAAHFYENYQRRKLFPIVVDAEAMLTGFTRLDELAESPDHIIPGHDPLVRRFYPAAGDALEGIAHRLDLAPTVSFKPGATGTTRA